MAAIHSKNTKPEMIVRKGLWSRGFRYRLNSPRLPGHPDLVLKKYRTCIFVNGCFWHGHNVTIQFTHTFHWFLCYAVVVYSCFDCWRNHMGYYAPR